MATLEDRVDKLEENDTVNYLTKNNIYAMAYRELEYMDLLNFCL